MGVRGRGNPTPCALATEKLLCHTQALPGAWVKGQSAGGCRNNSDFPSNPKFWLRVWEPSEVCAAVLQRPRVRTSDWAGRARAPAGDDRTAWSPARTPGQDYPAVGLHLWKVTLRPVAPARAGVRGGARRGLNPRTCSAGTHVVPGASATCPHCLAILGIRPVGAPSADLGLQDSVPSTLPGVSVDQRQTEPKPPQSRLVGQAVGP